MSHWVILTLLTLLLHLGALPYFLLMLLTSSAALTVRVTRKTTKGAMACTLPRKCLLVVIPAHNEEAGVATTIQSCLAVSYPSSQFEVLVIADNCTDQTASVAEAAGARVVERFEPMRKSKGHAIEFLIDRLSHDGELATLDALVVVDADSTVHPRLLERFAQGLERGDDWIQCNDAVGNPDACWRTRLMAYSFGMINGVELEGQSALGLSAGLRGNGMCLSTLGLQRVPWNTHGLTEDIEYSWLVRIAGGRIAYAGDVAVYATMLSRGGIPAIAQRLRWEHGRRALKRSMIGPLLNSPQLSWPTKIAAAIELTRPTLSFLLCYFVVLTLLTLVTLPQLHAERAHPYLEYSIGFCYASSSLGLLLHLASPFLLGFVPLRYVASFLYAPYYITWKAVIRFHAGPTTWLRTHREFTPRAAAGVLADDRSKTAAP